MTYCMNYAASANIDRVVKPKPNCLDMLFSDDFTVDGHSNTHLPLVAKKDFDSTHLCMLESRLLGRRLMHSGLWKHICLCDFSC